MQPYLFVSLGIRHTEKQPFNLDILEKLNSHNKNGIEFGFDGYTENEHGANTGDEGVIYLYRIHCPFSAKIYQDSKSITYTELEEILLENKIKELKSETVRILKILGLHEMADNIEIIIHVSEY